MRDTESVVQGKGFSACCCQRFVEGEECFVGARSTKCLEWFRLG